MILNPADLRMRYPATVTWCDTEPESWQDYTVCHTIRGAEELKTALDRFEQDVRNLKFALIGEIHDREGHELKFGLHAFQDRAFISFQPKHLLENEKGHYQYIPLRWSLADSAAAATFPPIGHLKGRERIDFLIWPGYDPYEIMPPYCVPMILVRQAIREYLATGEFSTCIGWGERADWSIAKE